MRICVITDTLGDVNGVSRFIQNTAELALQSGRDLHVLTSTRFAIPGRANIHNFKPTLSRRMPGYENLEIVLPPSRAIRARLDELRPDVVHVSTPGPVGLVGRRWAISRGIPLAGIYHTDFPAYMQHLFGRVFLRRFCADALGRFYRPFARVITRSAASIPGVEGIGVLRSRISALRPGIETSRFDPALRELGVWHAVGAPELARPGLNILAVSRLSIEKGMPLLVDAWRSARTEFARRAIPARLVIAGDGPYRVQMERDLAAGDFPRDTFFLGFRPVEQLSRLYATSDLFVFPSETDTLGQVVMEAQCSGLPALVTDQGGPGEIVQHDRTGLVLSARDPRAWGDAIVSLGCDPARRREMGRLAAAAIRPMTLRASLDDYWRLHEEVVQSAREMPKVTAPAAREPA
jgi:glycosyltransferase involved in cell wall biosynthesis